MNKFGVHGLVFSDRWEAAPARRAIDAAARIGYDVIEILVFDPDAIDTPLLGRLARDAGITLAVGMALPPDADISSVSGETSARGERMVGQCLEIASELGAGALSGLVYAAFERYRSGPTAAQRHQVMSALARLDQRARGLGLRLGIEPVNRYESYMVNTLDEAGAMIRTIGSSNLFIHADTFHMNIEEDVLHDVMDRNAALIGYVHLAESNRGALGSGNFDFALFVRALARARYDGVYTVEGFSRAVLSEETVGAIGLWRDSWTNSETAAQDALGFMRALVASETASVTPVHAT